MAMTLSQRKPEALAAQEDAPDLERIFQQHWERLYAAAYRLVGDPAEAEDLALEAFVQLQRRPPAQADNLVGWLYRVVNNLGLNALRARKRRQLYELQAGVSDLERNHPADPAAEFEKRQEQERVRAALRAMKSRSAQILLLRHSGLAYAEIAAALGVAPGSVGKLLTRAEREFEQKYGKGG